MPQVVSPTRKACRQSGLDGELHGAFRELVGVVVPLERLQLPGQRAEHRVVLRLGGQLDRMPADLRLRSRPDPGACRTRDQLRAEAHADRRHTRLECFRNVGHLARDPAVLVVLVRVLDAAEDHDRVVGVWRQHRMVVVGDDPAVEPLTPARRDLLEQAAAAE